MSDRQRRLYTGILLATTMFMAAANSLRSSLLTSMIDYYHLTGSQQGFTAFAVNLGCMLAMLLAIAVMGKFRKPILLAASVGLCVFLLLPQYLSPAFWIFLAVNGVFGVAVGMMDTLTSSSMADVQPGKRSAVMMNLLHASYGVGGILSPMLFAWILSKGAEWNYLYLILFGVGVAFLLIEVPVSMRQSKLSMYSRIQSAGKINVSDIKNFFADRVLLGLTLMMFMFGMYFGGFTTWIVRFINERYWSPLGDLALSLVFTGVTLGRLVTPFTGISPKNHLRFTGFITWALLTAGLLLKNGMLAVAFCCIAGIFCASAIPFAMNLACERMKENTLMASTILFLAMYIGQSVCSPIIGALEDAFSLEAAMEFTYIFAILYSVCALFGFHEKRKASV